MIMKVDLTSKCNFFNLQFRFIYFYKLEKLCIFVR